MDPNVFKTVMAVGRRMGATRKQLLAAAETGLVESGFRNLPGGDADSQGWRQERRSLYPNPTNVEASAARFFQEAKQHDQPGLSAGDLAAAVQRPAAQYRGRYQQSEARAAALLGMKGGDATAQAASVGGGGGSTTTNLPGATFKTTVPTVDQSGFEDARRNAIIGQLIARRNPNSILLRSGLLSTAEPSLSEFMSQQTTTSRVPSKTVTVPGSPDAPGRNTGPASSSRFGKSHSPLLELIHKSGGGGFAVKNGQVVSGPQVYGDVWNGHADHVHVAAGPTTIVQLGKLAQQMGLSVGENPHFGTVHRVHAPNSYHYKGEAIDVSGDPHAMNKYAAEVERLYGLHR